MKDICIILNTLYEKRTHHFFNLEVQQDLSVVHQTLHDHVFLEIALPLQAGILSIRKRIDIALQSIHIDENSNCHLVLNTHGSAGKSDLKHESVIYLVEELSMMKANIVQISALQCDGMRLFSGTSSAFNHSYRAFIPGIKEKKIYREASLFRLHKKLNQLKTDKAQAFKISGFDKSYNPFENQEEVKRILIGEGSHFLNVTINQLQFSEEALNTIKDKLQLVKMFQQLKPNEYKELANSFAKLQKYMKQQLILALKCHQEINVDSPLWCLSSALKAYAQTDYPHLCLQNPYHMEIIYKSWLNKYKFYSGTRIEVLSHFVTTTLQQRASKSACAASFFN